MHQPMKRISAFMFLSCPFFAKSQQAQLPGSGTVSFWKKGNESNLVAAVCDRREDDAHRAPLQRKFMSRIFKMYQHQLPGSGILFRF